MTTDMTTDSTPVTPAPVCTGCELAPATVRIAIRGCTHDRCGPCGEALLRRLWIVEPHHIATVTPIATDVESTEHSAERAA